VALLVTVLMPTANPERAALTSQAWKAKGYGMAYYVDHGVSPWDDKAFTVQGEYEGVWDATNRLAQLMLAQRSDVCLFAGDDMDPDPGFTAQEIGQQYLARFPDGFGVMQPCGDPQGMDASGRPAAARICGSAWFGPGWIKRSYRGKGPTDAHYHHFYGDESLYEVAQKLGVLWMRPDLTQFHRHWSWGHSQITDYQKRNQEHWEADQKLFFASKAANFPEGEPLP